MKSLLFTVYQTALILIVIHGLDAIFGTSTSHATFAAAIGFAALWSANSHAASAPTGQASGPTIAEAGRAQDSDHD